MCCSCDTISKREIFGNHIIIPKLTITGNTLTLDQVREVVSGRHTVILLDCSITTGACNGPDDHRPGLIERLLTHMLTHMDLARLESLDVQRTIWLNPAQVDLIIRSCQSLKNFSFSPAWLREWSGWVNTYEQHRGLIPKCSDFL